MTPETVLLQVLLGGIGGAVVSFVLQGMRASAEAHNRALAAARIVRMELIRNAATIEVIVEARRKLLEDARATFRRDAFDRLGESLALGLNDRYLSSLVGFYALHEYAADIAFTAHNRDVALSTHDLDWLRRWLRGGETAEAIINVAHARWWQRIVWRGHWSELNRRLDEEDQTDGFWPPLKA